MDIINVVVDLSHHNGSVGREGAPMPIPGPSKIAAAFEAARWVTSKIHRCRRLFRRLPIAQVLSFMVVASMARGQQSGPAGSTASVAPLGPAGSASASFVVVTKSTVTPATETTLALSPGGSASLTLFKGKPEDAPQKVNLYLSSFSDQNGNPVSVNIAKNEREAGALLLENLDFSAPLRLYFSVVGLPVTGKCAGTLIVEGVDKDDKRELFETLKLTLSRPSPATLVVTPAAPLTLSITERFPGRVGDLLESLLPSITGPDPTITATLRDKTGQIRLDGVCASVDQITKAPGGQFDLKTNVGFDWNGVPAPDFSERCDDRSDARTIPPNGQAVVRMRLKDLRTGEYNVTLRFRAANSQADDAQKLVLTLQVSHSPVWAVIVLAVAMALSYAGTKLISMRSQRLTLLGRIAALRSAWLRNEPIVLPVVWARAVLRQAEELARWRWLRAPDEIDKRLTGVSQVIKVLDQARRLRDALLNAGLNQMVANRAQAALNHLVAGIGASPLEDQTAQRLQSELNGLNAWLQPSQLEVVYWAAVKPDIDSKLAQVTADPPFAQRAQIAALIAALQRPDPAGLPAKIAREHDYAKLKVLWERRDRPEFAVLLEALDHGGSVWEIFRIADDAAWVRLAALQGHTLEIRGPDVGGPDAAQEAYDPIVFRVSTGDASLDETYLVRYGLEYHWTFTLTGPRNSQRVRLTPVSAVPQVVQYAPGPGKATVKVEIRRGVQRVTVPAYSMEVAKSQDFRFREGVESVEMASLVLAFVVGLASGLATYYANKAVFGSLQDYLALFTWGIGAEQGKNFIQTLQSYSTSPTKP